MRRGGKREIRSDPGHTRRATSTTGLSALPDARARRRHASARTESSRDRAREVVTRPRPRSRHASARNRCLPRDRFVRGCSTTPPSEGGPNRRRKPCALVSSALCSPPLLLGVNRRCTPCTRQHRTVRIFPSHPMPFSAWQFWRSHPRWPASAIEYLFDHISSVPWSARDDRGKHRRSNTTDGIDDAACFAPHHPRWEPLPGCT